ncbi:hypothetical protein [Nonomuraea mesophila]|nr:hypothetical protein [Nonomuraea mesophila]
MSDPTHDLQFVTTRAGGWCDPDTGVCIIDSSEEEDDTVSGTAGEDGT